MFDLGITTGSLFSGIGLLEHGLERAGLGPVLWQIEKDPFCRQVLAKHFPNAERFTDVVETTRPVRVDLLCGGFPCQPVSNAGKRLAQADPRWLWPHFKRIAQEVEPKAIVIENVLGLRTAGLRDVLADLADLGFDAEWACLSAADVGAPHVRKRLFIVATHPDRIHVRDEPGWLQRACERARAPVTREALEALFPPDANGEQRRRELRTGESEAGGDREPGVSAHSDSLWRLESARRFATQRGWARYCGWDLDSFAALDDGRAPRLVRGTLGKQRKALGNAVVVACAEVVGRALIDAVSLVRRAPDLEVAHG